MAFKKITLKILLIVAVAVISQQFFVSCNSAPKDKFIGLQLYSVRDAMKNDPQSAVAKVGDIGYKFVEAAGFNDGKFYGMSPEDFKQLCETNGLEFLGSHTGQDVPDSASWDKTMAWWDGCIAAHKAAGVKWIVQPFMGNTGYESLDGLKRYCKYFNAVGEKCKENGILFGYHNHDKEFSTVLDGKPVYDWMLQLTDPDKVMFEMDLYWAVVGGGSPVEYFDKYPGRFYLWHIKDEKELGVNGIMDFKPIFAAKDKAGVKYGIVEVEEYNFDPMVSVEKSLDFLKQADYVHFKKD